MIASGPRRPLPGRSIPDPGFAGDSGAADPALAAVLAACGRGECDDTAVLTVLEHSRLIVAMTAVPSAAGSATGSPPAGAPRDTDVEMALPIMLGTDGRRALPVFTSLETLAAWDPACRPVPVEARRAAAGAIEQRCAFLVLDPAGPVTWVADEAELAWLSAAR